MKKKIDKIRIEARHRKENDKTRFWISKGDLSAFRGIDNYITYMENRGFSEIRFV